MLAGIQLGAMYLTADGATQDEAIGPLPTLPFPVGPNQYTPITMLTLQPPSYDVQVGHRIILMILMLNFAAPELN